MRKSFGKIIHLNFDILSTYFNEFQPNEISNQSDFHYQYIRHKQIPNLNSEIIYFQSTYKYFMISIKHKELSNNIF